jgi:hypothetical protein
MSAHSPTQLERQREVWRNEATHWQNECVRLRHKNQRLEIRFGCVAVMLLLTCLMLLHSLIF